MNKIIGFLRNPISLFIMKITSIILVLLILTSSCFSQTHRAEADNYLAQTVNSFEIKKSTLLDAIEKLCKQEKIRVCMEDKRNFNKKTNKMISPRKISGQFKSITIQELLSQLCQSDQSHFWEYSRDGMINIVPASDGIGTYDSSTLQWAMDSFGVLTSNIFFLCSTTFLYGQLLQQFGIQIDWVHSTTSTNIGEKPITINLPPAVGRDVLNTIVKSAGPSFMWHLYWKEKKPFIEFRKLF